MRILTLVPFAAFLPFLPFLPSVVSAQSNTLMPVPARMTPGTGTMPITAAFEIAVAGPDALRLQRAVARLRDGLARRTGIPLGWAVPDSIPVRRLAVRIDSAEGRYPALGDDESYTLSVTPSGAELHAVTTWGALHGLETFLQLVTWGPDGLGVPAVRIEDAPRFAWRGLNLDVSRHFIPVEDVLRTLDGLAAVKMNVLHWHLSEDQGFRVESRVAPRLQAMGSDGLYYTQDEIRRVVEYAADRGIRVVPEFDVPGHSVSWLVGYPELAAGPGPFAIVRRWGVFDPVLDPTRDTTYAFLDAVFGEMAGLFPDAYFHIGGDEVNGNQWNANADIQRYVRANRLTDNHGLQAYFNRRLLAILQGHGKRMVGWDEIFHPDLPTDIVIQSWRGQRSLAATARAGYQGILSSGWYLDLYYSAGQHYAVDPLANETAALSPEEAARVLGGEACMWAEFVTPEILDHRIWPRAAAIAERLWSPAHVTDVADMYRRLAHQSVRLEGLGLTHRTGAYRMRERLAAGAPMAAIEALASAVEPVKGYRRGGYRPYTQQTSLNRMVDAIPSESEAVRRFRGLVERFVVNTDDDQAVREILAQLNAWNDQYEALLPWFGQSDGLAELEETSRAVSLLAGRGLWALGAADEAPPADPLAAIIDAAPAELLLVVAGAIAQLETPVTRLR